MFRRMTFFSPFFCLALLIRERLRALNLVKVARLSGSRRTTRRGGQSAISVWRHTPRSAVTGRSVRYRGGRRIAHGELMLAKAAHLKDREALVEHRIDAAQRLVLVSAGDEAHEARPICGFDIDLVGALRHDPD